MKLFLQDLVFATKLLFKDKTFNLVALLTLALCIGANTAIFSVINAVLLRPLPYPESDRLVEIYNSYPGVGFDKAGNGVPDYLDRKKETGVFEELTLFKGEGFNVGLEGAPERVIGMAVTPSYFRLYQIPPEFGRMFSEEEGVLGNEKVVVLSQGLWQQYYGGRRDILGQDIRLDESPYRIVGVMPEGFGPSEVRLWVPLAFTQNQMSDDARHSNSWSMVGRLRPGVSLAQAQERIDSINKRNEELHPEYLELLKKARFNTVAAWLYEEEIKDIRPALLILQVAVGLVLLIGCVNVANLLLVRSNVRLKELSIRAALGAGRWRLGRLLLTESMLLGICGGLLGFALGVGGVQLLRYLGVDRIPRGEEIHVDLSVLGYTLAIAVLTGLVFGTIPLVHVLRSNLAQVFRQTGRSGTADRPALLMRAVLVVAQVSLAFVLLVGAGLLISSFLRVLGVDPGFQPDKLLTARLNLPETRYSDSGDIRGFVDRALGRIESLPGVQDAGMTNFLPFSGQANASVITIPGKPLGPGDLPPVPGWATASPGYFRVMRIPLLRGRFIEETDTPDSQQVVLIDRFLAEKHWPGEDPLGQTILDGVGDDGPTPHTIVGVVGSVKTNDLTDKDPTGVVYFSHQQRSFDRIYLTVKQERDDLPLLAPITAEILGLDPELPLSDVKMMTERVDEALGERRAMVWLASIFAGLALLLSAIGIYGVLAYAVTQRTQEIGVRMALGAQAGQVVRSVAGQGLKLAGIGLVIGLIGAFILTRYLTSILFDVAPTDPWVFAGGTLLLLVVALVAAFIPSFRATRIHPSSALRYE